MKQRMMCGLLAFCAVGIFGTGLALGPAGEPPAARLAVCDIVGIADAVVAMERYTDKIKAEEEKAKEALQPIVEELQAIEDKHKDSKPDDEEAKKAFERYQQLQQQLGAAQQQIRDHMEDFLATQYALAYEEARAAAADVAEKLGYSYLIASRPADKRIEAHTLSGMRDAVLARTVVLRPDESDITADVKDELKISE